MDEFVVYGLTFISLIISLVAQIFVNSAYSKYKKVRNNNGITGKEAARMLLDKHGLRDVKVVATRGFLSDHYDPRSKTVALSHDNYNEASIAAVSVACHECGHAIQDKDEYIFMRMRASLVPITNFASYAGYLAILFGCIFGAFNLIWIGIFCELAILLFQIVTLPVEFDASRRATNELAKMNFFDKDELRKGKTMLRAAAFTYVASVATTLIQILRLVLMAGRRRD